MVVGDNLENFLSTTDETLFEIYVSIGDVPQ
jgi:hypothetical protein